MPPPLARALARLYLRPVCWFACGARRTARRNLRLAGFPDPAPVLGGVARSLARLLADFARFPQLTRQNISALVRCEGLPHYHAARSLGRGVLIVTAHLGNWELCAFAHALLHDPALLIVRPLRNPRLDALVERRRALSGNRILPKRDAARNIVRALAAGQTVAVVADENASPRDGVFVDFFGVKACAATAPARIARLTRAAVLPAYAVWSDAEQLYVIHYEPAVAISGDVLADTQRIQSQLEAAIRQYPDQWLWTLKRWKTRPPPEPEPGRLLD